ncbi:MAG: hypothetical protein ABIM21_06510, partial [candidate division WOR-3 bacterium]
AARFTHIGIKGADRLGTVVRAPGVTLENLIFVNLDPDLNSEGIATALLIIAPNCTVRNCVISSYEASPGDFIGCAVADLDLIVGGSTPTNVVFESCLFGTNKYGLASSWWIAPGIPPQIQIKNSKFMGNTSSGLEMDSGIVQIVNSEFIDNPGNAIDVGGGQAQVISSIFKSNGKGGAPTIELDLDPRWDDVAQAPIPGKIPPGSIELIGCKFSENSISGSPVARIHEGSLKADHCIFTKNFGPVILLDDGGEPQAPAQGFIDHCDIYGSEQSPEIKLEHSGGTQQIALIIKNSILSTGSLWDGFFLVESSLPDLSKIELSWSALFEPAIIQSPLPGQNNKLFPTEQPPYVSTNIDDPNGFTLMASSPLRTAGENGTYLGSNGAQIPVIIEPFPISIVIENKKPKLSWYSLKGVTYTVETTPNLTNPNWTAIATLQGTGAILNWEDSQAANSRFYRIRASK